MTDWAAVGSLAGAATLGVGLGEAAVRIARRPHLALELDEEGVHSRVEADGWPYIRLIARNSRLSRGAKGARVLVESYRATGSPLTQRITFGSPSLGWTSGAPETRADGSLTLPPGVARTFDLGCLTTIAVDGHGQREPPSMANQWGLQLGLHGLRIGDGRDRIPHGRWTIRLIATADDAATQTYEITIEWSPLCPDAAGELDTVVASIVKV